jgi:hypothetical protein
MAPVATSCEMAATVADMVGEGGLVCFYMAVRFFLRSAALPG